MKSFSYFLLILCVTSATLSGCKKNQKNEKTLILSPDQNQSEVHLFGNDNGVNQSGINSPEIEGGAGTYYGDPVSVRAIFKFDLSSIPANSEITSAKLTLYSNPTPLNGNGKGAANSGSDNTLFISRVVSDWTPSEVTWANQPETSTINQITIPHTDSSFLDLTDVNVKSMVQSMVAPGQNNGFQIRLKVEEPFTWRIFCSSKYTDKSKHPKLVITYLK